MSRKSVGDIAIQAWKNYHDNGKLLCEGHYKDGKREGLWKGVK